MLRIERVQNPQLWTRYCLWRQELETANGAAKVNEQLLFHGCHRDVIDMIISEGFDFRVANVGGSLGTGTYFAGHLGSFVIFGQNKLTSKYAIIVQAVCAANSEYSLDYLNKSNDLDGSALFCQQAKWP